MITTTTYSNGLGTLAASPGFGGGGNKRATEGSWFEALASAWGQTLDKQANKIGDMSDQISVGNDNPSQISRLTAESMRMSFMAQSSSSSIDSVGKSLETMARKG